MCEAYRDDLMGLVDGELDESHRQKIESHLHQCSTCSSEFRRLKSLVTLADRCLFATSPEIEWNHYWQGVCRKMERRAKWHYWAAGAVFLVLTGNVMFFGFSHSV